MRGGMFLRPVHALFARYFIVLGKASWWKWCCIALPIGRFERLIGIDQVFLILEVFGQKPNIKSRPALVVVGVHGHFAEEIFHVGMIDHQRPKAIPKVVECVKGFWLPPCCSGIVVVQRSGHSMVWGRYSLINWSVKWNMCEVARNLMPSWFWGRCLRRYGGIPQDLLLVGIPNDQLAERDLAGVVFVDVGRPVPPPPCEGYLHRRVLFTHQCWGFSSWEIKYFIVAFVGASDKTVACEFCFQFLARPVVWREVLVSCVA